MGSILSSQTDLPTLKNVDFMEAGARFFKNQHFRSKHGFETVLGFSWVPFGSSWGLFGAPSNKILDAGLNGDVARPPVEVYGRDVGDVAGSQPALLRAVSFHEQ